MQLHISSITLLLFSSLLFWSSALPFLPRMQRAQPERILIPRASYSVVPVDGGAPTNAAGGPLGATATITETIVHTAAAPAPTTVTIISTAPGHLDTATIASVVTVVESNLVQTSVVASTPTLAPTPVPTTASGTQTTASESKPSPETTLAPAPVPTTEPGKQTTTSESKPSPETTSATNLYYSPTLATPTPLAFTSSSNPSPSTTQSFTRSTISPSSTYDNGLWHTTYPPWSNSTSATVLAIKPR